MSMSTSTSAESAATTTTAPTPTASRMRQLTWSKGEYEISTDHARIPIDTLNQIFAGDDLFWAVTLPEDVMREMLTNSLCFGVFHRPASFSTSTPATTSGSSSSSKFVGLARCVTDFVTFMYLTDVYIQPAYRGGGLGAWLMGCIHETADGMPYLRKFMALTGDWNRLVPFYDRVLGMKVVGGKPPADDGVGGGKRSLAVLCVNGRGATV